MYLFLTLINNFKLGSFIHNDPTQSYIIISALSEKSLSN